MFGTPLLKSFPNAGLALICITITIMMQSLSGAPLIRKSDTQDTNLINDGVEKHATKNSSLLENELFEGDLAITEDLIRQHYNFSSLPRGEKNMTHEDQDVGTEITEGKQKFSKRAARMYATAALTVKVKYARNLQDTDPILNYPDPYVIVKATSSTGSHTKRTHYISGTVNPTWNTVLNFGCRRWMKCIELQVWDSDDFLTFGDDDMSAKQKTTLSPGNHLNNRHNAYGSGYMIFDYNFVLDGNDCSTNPCQNGGTCIDGCHSYTCRCISPYSGTNCQYMSGNLRVYARYGRNLPDEDPWWNYSDPYMEVIAIDAYGNSVRRRSSYKWGDQSPDWNEWLLFGRRAWRRFKVRVYDDDYNADDPLSSQITWILSSHTPQAGVRGVRLNCYRGYVVFDYYFN